MSRVLVLSIVSIVLVALLAVGCAQRVAPPAPTGPALPADITGNISDVQPGANSALGSIRIEGEKIAGNAYDRYAHLGKDRGRLRPGYLCRPSVRCHGDGRLQRPGDGVLPRPGHRRRGYAAVPDAKELAHARGASPHPAADSDPLPLAGEGGELSEPGEGVNTLEDRGLTALPGDG
jgi:hypothetical protein